MKTSFSFKAGRYTGLIAISWGVIWVRRDNKEGLRLCFPWNPALFSERYSYMKPIWKFAGFRLFKLFP